MNLLELMVKIGCEDQASSKIDKLAGKTQKSLGVLGMSAANLVSSAVSKAVGVISSSLGSAVSRVDTLNQYPKILQQMGYSATEAQASISKLSSGIEGLPTSLDAIVDSAKSLALASGDLDKATDAAIALNDAFLASGSSSEQAESGLLQYTQMLSKGTVDMESWRTLQQNMKYALQETAEAMGFEGTNATNDLYEALKSGEVTFDEFQDALIACDQAVGGFAETAAVGCAGIQTSMSNAFTAVVKNLANIIDAVNGSGAISQFFDTVKAAVNLLGSSITPAAAAAGEAFAVVTGKLSEFMSVLQSADTVGNGFIQAMENVFGIDVSTMMVDALMAFHDFEDAARALADTLVSAGEGLADFASKLDFSAACEALGSAFELIQGVFEQIQAQASEYLSPAMDELANAFNSLLANAGPLFEALQPVGDFFANVLVAALIMAVDALTLVVNVVSTIIYWFTDLLTSIQAAGESFSSFADSVGATLSALPGTVAGFLASVIASVVSWAASMLSNAISAASGFVSGVVGYLTALPGRAQALLAAVISAVTAWASNMVSGAVSAASRFASSLISGLSSLPGRVASIGSQIISGIVNGITGSAGRVVGAITGAVGNAISAAKSLLGIASPSKVFKRFGEYIDQGLELGIDAMAEGPAKAMARVVAGVEGASVTSTAYGAAAAGAGGYGAVYNIYLNGDLLEVDSKVTGAFQEFVAAVSRYSRG